MPYNGLVGLKDYNVYTYIDMNELKSSNRYSIQLILNELIGGDENVAEALIPISIILLAVSIIYLFWADGHSKGKEGIYLSAIDKFPYELLITILTFIIGICVSVFMAFAEYGEASINLTIYIGLLTYLASYVCVAIMVSSTVKRVKAKKFWKTFLIYRIFKWIKEKIKKISRKILDKSSSQKKIILYYIGFIIISSILGLIVITSSLGIFGIILIFGLWGWTLYKILEYNKKITKIKMALKDIYEGNGEVHLETEELTGTLKELSIYINDIASGFSNAINESLKSERLKTELITNVSHDIKTPLTSIINYVDLLKRENIEDEKAKEYIKVLDSKSQRLKKLIEDLVEASKASSGNIKLNIEDINLRELLIQVTGEFEDKFEKKNLNVELDLPEENVVIKADNRYIYRILENLYGNVAKYALEGTRVYAKLENSANNIELEIKNVSKEKLNISAEELMQRFVQGDRSRYTEGSGLGLSIAESLAELQNIKFNVEIDGDLFKAILKWE